MFKNERRTGEAGKSYPPFRFEFLPSSSEVQAADIMRRLLGI